MKNKIFFLFVIIIYSAFSPLQAQDLSLYKKNWLVAGADTMPFRVLLPLHYNPAKKYPLVMVLHGGGERGNDNEMQLIHGAKLFLQTEVREKYPAIVVFPQCSEDSYWSNVVKVTDSTGQRTFHFQKDGEPEKSMKLLQKLLVYLQEHYPLNKNKMYIGGLSMGGMGTYELVRRNPNVFAAAFAICGGARPETAKEMKNVSWWLFHGAQDNVVPPHFTEQMAKALKGAGAKVKFTLYPNAGHNSWEAAFAEPLFLPWLFANNKGF